MIDNSISPDTSDDESEGVKVYASLKSLEVQGQPPEIGDDVELTVKGKVESIEGDVACVSPDEVNGEPAPQPPEDKNDNGADDLDAQRDKLMAKAGASDNTANY